MKNKRKILAVILLSSLVSVGLFGQEDDLSESALLAELGSMESITAESFIDKMENLSKKSQLYIKLQEEKCSGDYTSFVIDENGERKLQKIKLTREERKLCKYSLINFQIKVNKLAYKARRSFLKKTHQRQLEQLKLLNSKRLSELEKAAQKYK